MNQIGGGMCSLCGSPGTNKTTCPLNAAAKKPSSAKHPNAEAGPAKQAAAPKPKAKAAPKAKQAQQVVQRKQVAELPKAQQAVQRTQAQQAAQRTQAQQVVQRKQVAPLPKAQQAVQRTQVQQAVQRKQVAEQSKSKAQAKLPPKVVAAQELFGRYVLRMNTDMMNDFHFPAFPSISILYILHLTDSELNELADTLITIGKHILKHDADNYPFISPEDIVKYIILSTLRGKITPDIAEVHSNLIVRFTQRIVINHNEDTIRPRGEVVLSLIKSFGKACFSKYRISNPTQWRLGSTCNSSILDELESYSKATNYNGLPLIEPMPVQLVKQCRHYFDNVLLRTEGIQELRDMNLISTLNIDDFNFADVPDKEVKFVQQFTQDMYDWISMDADRQHHADYGHISLFSLADLLYSIQTLRSIHTAEANAHLDILTRLVDIYIPSICTKVIFTLIKIGIFKSKAQAQGE